jgi:ABC-type Mn2+/Zn2+ transport system permease subunit
MTTDTLLLSVAMAVAAGLVGCFAVMRRMALAGDALSHVALPGIGVALAIQIHPVFGAACSSGRWKSGLAWPLKRLSALSSRRHSPLAA